MNLIIDGKSVNIAKFDLKKFKSSQGKMFLSGEFDIQCKDQFGNHKWREKFKNLVTNQGLNDILSVYFASGTQKLLWYLGLIGTNSTPLATWVSSDIGTIFTEFTGYTNATRLAWTPTGTINSESVVNTAAAYTMNAPGTIYGAFLSSSNVISGTSGILYSASLLTSSRPVVSNDQLNITYTITISSS